MLQILFTSVLVFTGMLQILLTRVLVFREVSSTFVER
jgi:hypothetical protein